MRRLGRKSRARMSIDANSASAAARRTVPSGKSVRLREVREPVEFDMFVLRSYPVLTGAIDIGQRFDRSPKARVCDAKTVDRRWLGAPKGYDVASQDADHLMGWSH